MGNWRTVNVVGTMSARDAAALRAHLGYPGYWHRDRYEHPASKRFGPLSFCRDQPSLCGLNDWPAAVMDRVGNLAERDYDPEDVAKTLRELLAVAPSMALKVHCGGEYESEQCVATITVGGGVVGLGPPQVARVRAISDEQAELNFLLGLFARR